MGTEKATDERIVEALNRCETMTAAAEKLGYSGIATISARIRDSENIVYRNKLTSTNGQESGLISLRKELVDELGVVPGESYYEITEVEEGRMVVEFFDKRAALREDRQNSEEVDSG